jgi:CRISPR/Cas system-associated exonuclease Cas4 (RecB family)
MTETFTAYIPRIVQEISRKMSIEGLSVFDEKNTRCSGCIYQPA